MPTTVYAENKQQEDGGRGRCASVWGFLRSAGSLDPNERDDAFIIARNRDCVQVWERQLEQIAAKERDGEPRPLLSPGQDADFPVFFELVGDEMKTLLRDELTKRNWRAVLKTAGF